MTWQKFLWNFFADVVDSADTFVDVAETFAEPFYWRGNCVYFCWRWQKYLWNLAANVAEVSAKWFFGKLPTCAFQQACQISRNSNFCDYFIFTFIFYLFHSILIISIIFCHVSWNRSEMDFQLPTALEDYSSGIGAKPLPFSADPQQDLWDGMSNIHIPWGITAI